MTGEIQSSRGAIGEFIDTNKQRVAVVAASVACWAAGGSPAEAHVTHNQAAPVPVEHTDTARANTAQNSNKPTFTAGEGMTAPYLTELNRVVQNYNLPIPESQITTTVGKVQKYCVDAASQSKTVNSIAMCINPTTNEMHMRKMPLWQIASYAAHEIEGHEIPDSIREKEKRSHPRKPSTFFINFFITAGMAENRREALKIMRSGPLDQKVSKDMRVKGVYADEALAEVAASCAQAGFVLAEGGTFTSWISDTAKVEVSDPEYTDACNYLRTEYMKHPDITKPNGEVPSLTAMGPNYYGLRGCSNKADDATTKLVWPDPNYAWPQWQRACRDSD